MIEEQILTKLKEYIQTVYNKDFETLVSYLYKDDLNTLRTNFEWLAKAMEPFGENEGLFNIFKGIENVDELSKLTNVDFVSSILKHRLRDMPRDKIQAMVKSTEVEEISHADYIATVSYSFENVFAGDGSRVSSSVELILSEGEWYVLFKPGIEKFSEIFKKPIDEYYEAKEKDQPKIAKETADDEIVKFSIHGFKNYNDDVLISPRFKGAGDFSEGLAAVQIFRKWGYIDKYGEIAIMPAYDVAEEFIKKRAKVAILNDNFDKRWGVINKKGKVIIPLIYSQLKKFSNGLLAVKKDGLWGFVNKKGVLVIDCKYKDVTVFKKGKAQALYIHQDGNEWLFYIDKEGNELGEVPNEDVEIYY